MSYRITEAERKHIAVLEDLKMSWERVGTTSSYRLYLTDGDMLSKDKFDVSTPLPMYELEVDDKTNTMRLATRSPDGNQINFGSPIRVGWDDILIGIFEKSNIVKEMAVECTCTDEELDDCSCIPKEAILKEFISAIQYIRKNSNEESDKDENGNIILREIPLTKLSELSVLNKTILYGDLTVKGAVIFEGNVDSAGNTLDSLNVTGITTLNKTNINDELNVIGSVDIIGNVDIKGNVDIDGEIITKGEINIHNNSINFVPGILPDDAPSGTPIPLSKLKLQDTNIYGKYAFFDKVIIGGTKPGEVPNSNTPSSIMDNLTVTDLTLKNEIIINNKDEENSEAIHELTIKGKDGEEFAVILESDSTLIGQDAEFDSISTIELSSIIIDTEDTLSEKVHTDLIISDNLKIIKQKTEEEITCTCGAEDHDCNDIICQCNHDDDPDIVDGICSECDCPIECECPSCTCFNDLEDNSFGNLTLYKVTTSEIEIGNLSITEDEINGTNTDLDVKNIKAVDITATDITSTDTTNLNDLIVGGKTELNGTATFEGNVIFENTADFKSEATIETANITGTATIATADIETADINNVTNITTLNVNGNIENIDSVTITGDTTISGETTFNGKVELNNGKTTVEEAHIKKLSLFDNEIGLENDNELDGDIKYYRLNYGKKATASTAGGNNPPPITENDVTLHWIDEEEFKVPNQVRFNICIDSLNQNTDFLLNDIFRTPFDTTTFTPNFNWVGSPNSLSLSEIRSSRLNYDNIFRLESKTKKWEKIVNVCFYKNYTLDIRLKTNEYKSECEYIAGNYITKTPTGGIDFKDYFERACFYPNTGFEPKQVNNLEFHLMTIKGAVETGAMNGLGRIDITGAELNEGDIISIMVIDRNMGDKFGNTDFVKIFNFIYVENLNEHINDKFLK